MKHVDYDVYTVSDLCRTQIYFVGFEHILPVTRIQILIVELFFEKLSDQKFFLMSVEHNPQIRGPNYQISKPFLIFELSTVYIVNQCYRSFEWEIHGINMYVSFHLMYCIQY